MVDVQENALHLDSVGGVVLVDEVVHLVEFFLDSRVLVVLVVQVVNQQDVSLADGFAHVGLLLFGDFTGPVGHVVFLVFAS